MSLSDLWRAFRDPYIAEERVAAEAVWRSLPDKLRGPEQGLGRWSTGCGATWGVMERCDFACTACYLTRGSNAAEPLPFEEVNRQLETMRAHYGPGGRIQITAGEVTLLPVEEMVRILRRARSLQLIPMVMTHGQRYLREPGYLERLVVEGGLDRVAIHVDTTQRGRDGGDPRSEAELMPVRDAMAGLVRETRRRTGRTLHAAHTVTVTRANLAELPDIVRWTTRNADAFRLLALQPAAEVGRTREASNTGRRDVVWSKIHEGLGKRIRERTWDFGHRDCNQFAFVWIVGRNLVEVRRENSRLDRWFVRRWLNGGLKGWTSNGESRAMATARLLGRFARDPRFPFDVAFFCVARALGEWRLALRPAIPRPFAISVHNFMDEAEIETPRGRERIESCLFRVPVDGRMVSMCEFNGGGLRARKVDEIASASAPAPASAAGGGLQDPPVARDR